MRLGLPSALAALVSVSFCLADADADACGGCFAASSEVTVVTDHRMALALSKTQTVLWDQIRYSGDPREFAWVLPVREGASIDVGKEDFFTALDTVTRTVVYPPGRSSMPVCLGGCAASSSGAAGGGQDPETVTVLGEKVVGPYEAVTLRAIDPDALVRWLQDHGFAIPEATRPVIDAYQREGFDFIALRLRPDCGVRSMQPVRVTSPGADPTLPLRMVAAGTGPKVGITLWVLAEGGYEPTNFQTFSIDNGDLVWDWSASRSNFAEVRAAKTAAAQNAAWEIESSTTLTQFRIENLITSGGRGFGPVSAAGDYLPVDGMTPMTADEVRQDDLQTLFAGIPNGAVRATRLRADLARAALVKDLQLGASADQSERSNVHNLTQDKNRPSCPTYPPCPGVYTGLGGGGGGCSTTSSRGGDDLGLAVAAGFLGLALARSRRKRG